MKQIPKEPVKRAIPKSQGEIEADLNRLGIRNYTIRPHPHDPNKLVVTVPQEQSSNYVAFLEYAKPYEGIEPGEAPHEWEKGDAMGRYWPLS